MAVAHIIYKWQYKHFNWRCIHDIKVLFVPSSLILVNKSLSSESQIFIQVRCTSSSYVTILCEVNLCEHMQSNSLETVFIHIPLMSPARPYNHQNKLIRYYFSLYLQSVRERTFCHIKRGPYSYVYVSQESRLVPSVLVDYDMTE